MRVGNRIICYIISAAVLFCIPWTSNASEKQNDNDWHTIWQKPIPVPETIEVKQLGGLGEELENRKWQMISTQYHQIYYQPSTDTRKISDIYSLIDNIYRFLQGRSPKKLKTPIKVFLVPNELGRSRCSKLSNAMRTGVQGDTFSY